MKLDRSLNKDSLKILYLENQDYLLPLGAIVISFLLFFIFILPQVLSFPARSQEIGVENEKLNVIKEAERTVATVNKDILDSELEIASKALPSSKPFEQILNGISTAASLSNVQVLGYQFQNQNTQLLTTSKFSSLLFDVTVGGDVQSAIRFIDQLYKTYPISEIVGVTGSDKESKIRILFYYKAFPSVLPEDRINIKNMSTDQKNVLDKITNWDDSEESEIIQTIQDASSSGETTTSPF